MSRVFLRGTASAIFAAVTALVSLSDAFGACAAPAYIDATISTSVSTTASEAIGLGSGSVKNFNGEICWFMQLAMTASVKEGAAQVGTATQTAFGEITNLITEGPARVGYCYNAFVTASAHMPNPFTGVPLFEGVLHASNQGTQQCWEGPPDPPPGGGGGEEDWQNACNPVVEICWGSPIVVDRAGTGYRLTSLATGVRFDLRNEHIQRQVSWTAGGVENAFLALDRNDDGRITRGSELFGNYTPLRSGARAANGFEALAEFDANGDGRVDNSDGIWPSLLLWTDRNHDGISSSDEIENISETNVVALETSYQTIGRRDEAGNIFPYVATLHLIRHGQALRQSYFDVYLRLGP